MVRLMLLERLLQHLPQLHSVGGVRAIPYMQVILMLTADLDGEDEKDKGALDDLLTQLIGELGMHKKVSRRFLFLFFFLLLFLPLLSFFSHMVGIMVHLY